jgi:hypothetical protein
VELLVHDFSDSHNQPKLSDEEADFASLGQYQPSMELFLLFYALLAFNSRRILLVPWNASILVLYELVYLLFSAFYHGVEEPIDPSADLQRPVPAQTFVLVLLCILREFIHVVGLPKLVHS